MKDLKEKHITEEKFAEEQIDKHQDAILYHRRMIEGYMTGENMKKIREMEEKEEQEKSQQQKSK